MDKSKTTIQQAKAKISKKGWLWLVLPLALLVLVGILAACSQYADPFGNVDRAASDTHIASLGHVVVDRKIGSNRPLSQKPQRRITVLVSGSAAEVEARIQQSMRAAGFAVRGPSAWERRYNNNLILVNAVIEAPGTHTAAYTVLEGHVALTLLFDDAS